MLLFILFMLAVGGLVAVGLSLFVARSVAGPLRDLEAAMRAVARGDLRAQCPVVGNDEIGAVAEGFNRMVGGLRERELIRETFGKYVTEEVRDEILSGRVDLEGQTREVTILFSDIRDFTPWVEAHDPREVVRDLNAYFTLMEGAIREHHGLVLQYIGDEIEAVFGAPVANARHPDLALRAALEMRQSAGRVERRAGQRGAGPAAPRDRHPHRARARRQHRQSRPAVLDPGGRSGERGLAAAGTQQGLRLGHPPVGGDRAAARGAGEPRAALRGDGEGKGDGGGGLPRRVSGRAQRVAARATAWTSGAAFGFETSPRTRMSVTDISLP